MRDVDQHFLKVRTRGVNASSLPPPRQSGQAGLVTESKSHLMNSSLSDVLPRDSRFSRASIGTVRLLSLINCLEARAVPHGTNCCALGGTSVVVLAPLTQVYFFPYMKVACLCVNIVRYSSSRVCTVSSATFLSKMTAEAFGLRCWGWRLGLTHSAVRDKLQSSSGSRFIWFRRKVGLPVAARLARSMLVSVSGSPIPSFPVSILRVSIRA